MTNDLQLMVSVDRCSQDKECIRTFPVTVVIPTFNREKLITRALDSIACQTIKPEAIIIVDDASSDETVEVAKRWACTNSIPLLVECQKNNSGPAAARNRGIQLAKTEWVAFLDSDDEYFPYAIEKLSSAVFCYPSAVLSFCDALVRSDEGDQPGGLFSPHVSPGDDAKLISDCGGNVFRMIDPIKLLIHGSIIPTSATLLRRESALEAGGMPENLRSGEDWIFWLRLALTGEFIFQVVDSSIHHRHNENLTNPNRGEWLAREQLLCIAMLREDKKLAARHPEIGEVLSEMHEEAVDAWHYHLSRKGLGLYIEGLAKHGATLRAGTGISNVFGDTRSLLRAIAVSALGKHFR